ncbi:MAG: hypothetical protein AAGC56_14230, partial [Pseudomonadota bacterium]
PGSRITNGGKGGGAAGGAAGALADLRFRPAEKDAEAQRTRAVRTASGLQGVFFCGPEAQIGQGSSGAAGRAAALSAIRYSRTRAVAS